MPIAEDQITELKHAYRVLDVPLYASATSIKKTYRRLVKRWHPDLYPSGTQANIEATHMTKLINEAYSTIEHAPLRYHIEAHPQAQARSRQTTCSFSDASIGIRSETFSRTDQLEFWVRFVFGALCGTLVSFRLVLDYFDHPAILALCVVGVILGFGFGAARYGDKFWHSILRHWWLWS